MKKTILIISCLTVAGLYACNKDHDAVSEVVDVSYPQITLNGDKYVSLMIGESYSDPGAVLTDDISGAASDITAEINTLDPNTPGLYYMQYSGRNQYGYVTKVGRYIAVTNYPDAVDLSGQYLRQAAPPNDRIVNLSRVSRALYRTDDMGGAGLPDAACFAVINDSTIDLGPQLSESIGEEIYGVNAFLEISPADTSYGYALSAPGYGTALRVFVKVP